MQEVGAVVVMYLHPEERQGQVVVEQVRLLIRLSVVIVELLELEVAVVARALDITVATAAQASSSSKQTGKPMKKIYKLYGIDTAMAMLRPGAKWEISNSHFTRWDDPRPCPTWEEVQDTMEKIKAFEDSINTIYTEEQMKQHNEWVEMFNKAAA
jgi:hypothetical protein